jgi:hypothetical protein
MSTSAKARWAKIKAAKNKRESIYSEAGVLNNAGLIFGVTEHRLVVIL